MNSEKYKYVQNTQMAQGIDSVDSADTNDKATAITEPDTYNKINNSHKKAKLHPNTEIEFGNKNTKQYIIEDFDKINRKKKKRRARCANIECNTKLTMIDIDMECKCGMTFCGRHRLPEYHKCTYDHCKEAKEIMNKTIMAAACITNKVTKI